MNKKQKMEIKLYPTVNFRWVVRKITPENFREDSIKVLQQLYTSEDETMEQWVDIPIEEEIVVENAEEK
jgi:histone H3/H4